MGRLSCFEAVGDSGRLTPCSALYDCSQRPTQSALRGCYKCVHANMRHKTHAKCTHAKCTNIILNALTIMNTKNEYDAIHATNTMLLDKR